MSKWMGRRFGIASRYGAGLGIFISLCCACLAGCGAEDADATSGGAATVELDLSPGDVLTCNDPTACAHAHPDGPCPWCGRCLWEDSRCIFKGRKDLDSCPCYEGETE